MTVSAPSPTARIGRRVWRVALLALALTLAWKFVDVRAFGRAFARVPPASLALLFVIVTVDRLVTASKWRFIGRSLGVRLPYWDCVRAYFGATVLGQFLPTSLGGDLYRGARLSGGREKGPVFVTIAMEKVVNAAASLVWAWGGLAFLRGRLSGPVGATLTLNLALVTAAVVGVYLFLLSPPLHARLLALIRRVGIRRDLSALEAAYTGFSRSKGRLAAAVAFGLIENLGEYGLFYFAGRAVGISVSGGSLFSAIVLNHVVRKVVLYADSWSVAEAAAVAAYGLIGVPPHQALAMSLLRQALNTVSALPGALFFLGKGRGQRQKEGQLAETPPGAT